MEEHMLIGDAPGANLPAIEQFTEQNIVYCSVDDAVERIIALGRRSGGRVNFVNPHSLVLATKDERFRKALLQSELNLADGIGVFWGAELQGLKPKGRSPGPDVMTALLHHSFGKAARHFILGGRQVEMNSPAELIRSRFGAVDLEQFVPGEFPFGPPQIDEMAGAISRSGALFVWVCLGTRKQELLGAELFQRYPQAVYLHVGAAVDFLSAKKKRAPKVLRELGLEWAYRLALEPRRLLLRNMDSPVYLLQAIRRALVVTKNGGVAPY